MHRVKDGIKNRETGRDPTCLHVGAGASYELTKKLPTFRIRSQPGQLLFVIKAGYLLQHCNNRIVGLLYLLCIKVT